MAQSCPTLCYTMGCSTPDSLSMGFSRQEYWSGLLFPSPGNLPDPGIEARSPAVQADSLSSEIGFIKKFHYTPFHMLNCICKVYIFPIPLKGFFIKGYYSLYQRDSGTNLIKLSPAKMGYLRVCRGKTPGAVAHHSKTLKRNEEDQLLYLYLKS